MADEKKAPPRGENERLFDQFYHFNPEGVDIAACLGTCSYEYNPNTGRYDKISDGCGGSCRCPTLPEKTGELRKTWSLATTGITMQCMPPGSFFTQENEKEGGKPLAYPTDQQVEVLIELLKTIRRLRTAVVGLSLALAAVVVFAAYLLFR